MKTKTKPRTEPPEWTMEIAKSVFNNIANYYATYNDLPAVEDIAWDIASSPAVKELVDAAQHFQKEYIELVESGDAGNWNPYKEEKVIRLQSALKPFQASKASTGGG